jgi:ketosteroid isomerase-like protein
MSEENVEIVRRGYEALNRRDFDAWLEFFHQRAWAYFDKDEALQAAGLEE